MDNSPPPPPGNPIVFGNGTKARLRTTRYFAHSPPIGPTYAWCNSRALPVNFDYFGALMFRQPNRNSSLVSRRAARYGKVSAIVRQVPRHLDHLDVSFRRRHRASHLLRIWAAAAKSASWLDSARPLRSGMGPVPLRLFRHSRPPGSRCRPCPPGRSR